MNLVNDEDITFLRAGELSFTTYEAIHAFHIGFNVSAIDIAFVVVIVVGAALATTATFAAASAAALALARTYVKLVSTILKFDVEIIATISSAVVVIAIARDTGNRSLVEIYSPTGIVVLVPNLKGVTLRELEAQYLILLERRI